VQNSTFLKFKQEHKNHDLKKELIGLAEVTGVRPWDEVSI
jgi:hypothetical protein